MLSVISFFSTLLCSRPLTASAAQRWVFSYAIEDLPWSHVSMSWGKKVNPRLGPWRLEVRGIRVIFLIQIYKEGKSDISFYCGN
jgi:hypothetical protein